MNIEFVRGQRWLVDTAPELGLGVVTDADRRRVQLLFPATGETRTFAHANAPLTRVRFRAGDRIKDRAGAEGVVQETEEQAGLLRYRIRLTDRSEALLVEQDLNDQLRLHRPQEKLAAGRIDSDRWFSLRLQAWQQRAALARSPVQGLLGARIGLISHQLHVADRVARQLYPRALLADEVGLGKTIEAGLILHRLISSGRTRRALILVPPSLQHQWLVEMRRRFNLPCSLVEPEWFERGDAANPLEGAQLLICNLDLITGLPAAARSALGAAWDLLIVDEAHHLAWSPEDSSLGYQIVAELAAATPGVLLLTATPEQLGQAGHFARLHLLDPERFADYDEFLAAEAAFGPVAALAERLLDGAEPAAEDRTRLGELGVLDGPAGTDVILQRLLDRHGTSRVLFRNTRAAISGFPQRCLHPSPLPAPPPSAPPATIADALTPERQSDATDWTATDPRVPWLLDTLRQLRPAKVLLICAHADTVLALQSHLFTRHGLHAAVFHEGMSLLERDRAAAYFAASEDGTQVLLCSEIGSEGRNFQFVQHLILFDLPANPDLLEQRIGRLDRIGQQGSVQIHVPYLTPGPMAVLFRWYAEVLDAFTAPRPAATEVTRQFRAELDAALTAGELPEALAEAARSAAHAATERLAQGRDRLLELQSHDAAQGAALIEQLQLTDNDHALRDFMERLWDLYGVEHESGTYASQVVRPGAHMLHDRFPELPEDGVTVTFDRSDALTHEDRLFLTWEHPMVSGALEWLLGDGIGNTAITVLKSRDLPSGQLYLELLYVLECAAPPDLHADRFLPPTPLRLVLDQDGRERTADLAHEALRGVCLSRNRKLIRTVLDSQGERLLPLFAAAEHRAEAAAQRERETAAAAMTALFGAERERLQALLAAHPVGQARRELEALDAAAEQLQRHFAEAQLRLDAVRLLLTL